MALPIVKVENLSALQSLAVDDDACEIMVTTVDAVRHAPKYLDILAGWRCGQKPMIRVVERFAVILAELSDSIISALEQNASNKVMVRHLGSSGRELRRLSSHYSLHAPPALICLVRSLSTALIDAARPARIRGRLEEIAACVEVCLDSSIDLEALPTATVESLLDLEALGIVVEPHDILIRAVNTVRNAPKYLHFVLQKKGIGWKCDQEARLRKVTRFAKLLIELSDNVIPRLRKNAADAKMIRWFRSRGIMISRVIRFRRRSPAKLVFLVCPLANKIKEAAKSVLRGKRPIAWLARRLDVIGAHIQTCLDSYIHMEEDEEP